MSRSLISLLLVIMSLYGTVTHAKDSHIFLFMDEQGQPLQDVIVEPVGETNFTQPNQVATIDQVNKRFKPTQIVITKGQSVDFPNSDNIRHHVYSFSKAKTFELKLYADTPEHPIKFDDHGVVVLGCNIHDTMIGYIYVSLSPHSVMSDKDGKAILTTDEPINVVNIWHRYQASGPESLRTVSISDLHKDSNGNYVINLTVTPPEPTSSFEDTFGGFSEEN